MGSRIVIFNSYHLIYQYSHPLPPYTVLEFSFVIIKLLGMMQCSNLCPSDNLLLFQIGWFCLISIPADSLRGFKRPLFCQQQLTPIWFDVASSNRRFWPHFNSFLGEREPPIRERLLHPGRSAQDLHLWRVQKLRRVQGRWPRHHDQCSSARNRLDWTLHAGVKSSNLIKIEIGVWRAAQSRKKSRDRGAKVISKFLKEIYDNGGKR